jgi:hypothetical protein
MSHLRAEARGAVDVQPRHFWAKRATLRFVPLDPPYAPCGSSSAQAFHSDSQIWLHCFHPARPTEPLHSAPPPLHKSICARLRTSSNSLSFRCCFENEPFQPHQALPSGQVLANPLTDSVSSPSRKKDAGSATNQPPDRLPRAFSETLQPIGEVLKSPILSAGVGSKLHTQGGRRPLLLLSAGVIPAPPFAATATAEPNCSPDFENAGPARLMLGSAGISPMPCCLADMPAWARLRC